MRKFGKVWMTAAVVAGTWAGVVVAEGSSKGLATFSIRPSGKLWLEGSAPMHGFESTATRVTLAMGVERTGSPASWTDILSKGRMKELALIIPVLGLESGKDDLDDNLYRAMKAKEFSVISFTLQGYTAKAEKDGSFTVSMKGSLTIAGQSKPTVIEAKAVPMGDRLLFSGKRELFMKDFGIEPPSMMLGMVTTDNRIVVKFDFVLDPVTDEIGKLQARGEGK